MPDVDSIHPDLGDINPTNTPEISKRFCEIRDQLLSEGHCFIGVAEDGYLDSSVCCRLIAEKLHLEEPKGYFSYQEYKSFLENASWGTDSYARQTELFVTVCLEEQLDIHFS